MKISFLLLIFIFFHTYCYSQTASLEEINRNIRNEEANLKKMKKKKSSIVKKVDILS